GIMTDSKRLLVEHRPPPDAGDQRPTQDESGDEPYRACRAVQAEGAVPSWPLGERGGEKGERGRCDHCRPHPYYPPHRVSVKRKYRAGEAALERWKVTRQVKESSVETHGGWRSCDADGPARAEISGQRRSRENRAVSCHRMPAVLH